MSDDRGAFRRLQDSDPGSESPGSDDRVARFIPGFADYLPQFRPHHFTGMVHYCCWLCEDPRILDFAKLNWICWYSECHNYLLKRTSLTGATYRKFADGPIATPTTAAIMELEKAGALARRTASLTGIDRYFAVTKPDLSMFDSDQVAMIDMIVRAVCFNIDATMLSRQNYDRIIQIARTGEEIPYFTVLAGRAGSPSESDIAWAISRVRDDLPPSARSDFDAPRVLDRNVHLACTALVWHLLREPEIGSALHLPKSSWFLYKQRGLRNRVPDVTALYTFVMDELIIRGLRFDDDL